MKASKTQAIGHKTAPKVRHSFLSVKNKDPRFDYCFRSRKDIEEGGGEDRYGWVPVGATNSAGEEWDIPHPPVQHKGRKQIILQDTILCKRPKQTTKYFKGIEDQKYNAQVSLVKNAARNAQVRLRQAQREAGLEADAMVEDRSTIQLKQRQGPSVDEGDE